MMEDLAVFRVVRQDLVLVGTVFRNGHDSPTFTYHHSYLERPHAEALSCSLPLRAKPFGEREFRPYFDGLVPEGPMRTALAAQIGARKDDYLTVLASSGLDCIGDVVVRDASEGNQWDEGSYEPIDESQLLNLFTDLTSMTNSNITSRLSLAGTQGKVGLAHVPGTPLADGWLRPKEGAASTHILKASDISRIEELELICMGAAEACGVRSAQTHAMMLSEPIIVSERYDRVTHFEENSLSVERLHQEDFAQAFGVNPRSKYLELEGGTYHAISQLLYERSSAALADIDQLAHVAVFDYLIGNCDNHLKNLSIIHAGDTLRLAPAYDLVCTTYFERFSRDMGRRLGSTRRIDNVTATDFDLLAAEIGMGRKRMRGICAEVSSQIASAVIDAGERFSQVIESLPYTAEDLIDDMEPRLKALL